MLQCLFRRGKRNNPECMEMFIKQENESIIHANSYESLGWKYSF
jgi:hypothetical protein